MIKTMTANQKMAELFQRNKSTISRHIFYVFEPGEPEAESVAAFFATTAADDKNYNVIPQPRCNHQCRLHGQFHSKVRFRILATQVLREYLVKGFAMNDTY